MITQSRIKKYQELQNDMETFIRELTTKKRIIKQNIDAYQSMRNSLVKALTSKKRSYKISKSFCFQPVNTLNS